jgi:hypothetical protein
MSRHLLGVLEPSVVLQVNRYAGCPPGVASDGGKKTRSPSPNKSQILYKTRQYKVVIMWEDHLAAPDAALSELWADFSGIGVS